MVLLELWLIFQRAFKRKLILRTTEEVCLRNNYFEGMFTHHGGVLWVRLKTYICCQSIISWVHRFFPLHPACDHSLQPSWSGRWRCNMLPLQGNDQHYRESLAWYLIPGIGRGWSRFYWTIFDEQGPRAPVVPSFPRCLEMFGVGVNGVSPKKPSCRFGTTGALVTIHGQKKTHPTPTGRCQLAVIPALSLWMRPILGRSWLWTLFSQIHTFAVQRNLGPLTQ